MQDYLSQYQSANELETSTADQSYTDASRSYRTLNRTSHSTHELLEKRGSATPHIKVSSTNILADLPIVKKTSENASNNENPNLKLITEQDEAAFKVAKFSKRLNVEENEVGKLLQFQKLVKNPTVEKIQLDRELKGFKTPSQLKAAADLRQAVSQLNQLNIFQGIGYNGSEVVNRINIRPSI